MTIASDDRHLLPAERASPILNADDVIERVWKVAHELPEDGKLALFDESKSQLVIVNALGAAFWWRLDGVRSLGDIAAEISEDVQGAPAIDQVLGASIPFLNSLIERGALALR